MLKPIIVSVLLLLCTAFGHAQTNAACSNALLFVHTDKTVYTNNEEIWFSGYLIKSGGVNVAAHKFMIVSLARQDDNKVLIHQKFIMEAGFSNGNFRLPDTIAPGDYKLLAYTNLVDKNNKPLDVFTQHLTIKSVNQETLTASMALVDTLADKNGNYHVVLFASPNVVDKKNKVEVTYHVGNSNLTKVEQDLLGKYEMLVAEKDIAPANPTLYAAVKYGADFKYLSIKLPRKAPKLNIKFYPEGGNITANMANIIGMEVRVGTNPANLYGVLLKDGNAIDTINTSNGIARFRLYHDAKSVYTFKVLKKKGSVTDIYPLPPAVISKLVLSVPNAVSDDTVRFKVTAAVPQKARIIVRDKQQEYFSFQYNLQAGKNDFAVDLAEIPKGTGTITILDSLGRPVAERLFFAHYNRRVIAEIKTDKSSYSKREKVNATITLTDALTGQPVSALLSVACVQGNRIETVKQKDIESYTYFYHDTPDSTLSAQLINLKNRGSLEDNLLIRGWRRYTWQDTLLQKDTAYNSLTFTGNITRNNKPTGKPIIINIHSSEGMANVETTNVGNFEIKTDKLYSTYDDKVFLFATANYRVGLKIKYTDPYELVSSQAAKNSPSFMPLDYKMDASTGYMADDLSKTRRLKQVDIKYKRDDDIYGTKGMTGVNSCGDYVCFMNVLNCVNHPTGTPAVVGERYYQYQGSSMIEKMYKGCTKQNVENGTLLVDGIYSAKEFYGLTESDLAVNIPQYVSTLLWNPALTVNETGKAAFSFYNSDVSGPIKIVIQGVTTQSLVSVSGGYNVAK